MNGATVILLSALVALGALWWWAFIEVLITPNDAFTRTGANKGLMVVLLVLAGWVGALYWFGFPRRRIRRLTD